MKIITRKKQNEILKKLITIQIYTGVRKDAIGDEDFSDITDAIARIGYDVAGGSGLAYMGRIIDGWVKYQKTGRTDTDA